MLLGADRIAMGGKKITAKSYVQDGLIAMWDGIENAGWGVHDASATVWKDLIGENNIGTFDSGCYFDEKCFVASAKRYCAKFNSYSTSNIKTIEILVKLYGYNGLELIGFSSGSGYTTRWFGVRANKTFSFGQASICSNVATPLNLHHYAGTTEDVTSVAGISFNNYLDGLPVSSAGTGMSWIGVDGVGYINGIASAYSSSEIYAIRLYNRALTAAEIAANYAVDAARFGLT